MVEPSGIEPPFRRCERRVLPLNHGPTGDVRVRDFPFQFQEYNVKQPNCQVQRGGKIIPTRDSPVLYCKIPLYHSQGLQRALDLLDLGFDSGPALLVHFGADNLHHIAAKN